MATTKQDKSGEKRPVTPPVTTDQNKLEQPQSETVALILRVHDALDEVYGTGFAKDNPDTVGGYLLAFSVKELAGELSAVRELIATGAGAITVGVEHVS